MPIQRCKRNGKSGYRFGKSGKCYTGPGAKAKARRQERAIRASGWTENQEVLDAFLKAVGPAGFVADLDSGGSLLRHFVSNGGQVVGDNDGGENADFSDEVSASYNQQGLNGGLSKISGAKENGRSRVNGNGDRFATSYHVGTKVGPSNGATESYWRHDSEHGCGCGESEGDATQNAARRNRNAKPVRSKAAPNTLRMDPTRTTTLRRMFEKEFDKRFNRFQRELRKLVVEEDAFGLRWAEVDPMTVKSSTVPTTVNKRFAFSTTPEQLEAFEKWLEQELGSTVMGSPDPQAAYYKKYVEEGFKKGAGRSFEDTKALQKANAWTPQESAFYSGTKEQFLQHSFARPVAVNKVKLLAGRVFTELKGVTQVMAQGIKRDLTDGLVQGDNPRTVARRMFQRVDVAKKRARTIARTETIRAHAEGQLDALEELQVDKLRVMVEWSATPDDRTCPLCADMDGVILTMKEARGLIPRHPNCRCAYIPANILPAKKRTGTYVDPKTGDVKVGTITPKKNTTKVKQAIDKSIEREGKTKETTRWVGADTKIVKYRKGPAIDITPTQVKALPPGLKSDVVDKVVKEIDKKESSDKLKELFHKKQALKKATGTADEKAKGYLGKYGGTKLKSDEFWPYEAKPYSVPDSDFLEKGEVIRLRLDGNSKIYATQKEVDKDKLIHFIDNPDAAMIQAKAEEKLPWVYQYKGKYYIHDGHHRLTSHDLLGKDFTDVVLLKDVKNPGTPSPGLWKPSELTMDDLAAAEAKAAARKLAEEQAAQRAAAQAAKQAEDLAKAKEAHEKALAKIKAAQEKAQKELDATIEAAKLKAAEQIKLAQEAAEKEAKRKAAEAARKAAEEEARKAAEEAAKRAEAVRQAAIRAEKAGKLPSPADLEFKQRLSGSTRPELHANKYTGKQWVRKSTEAGIQPAHLESEALADDLYRILGADVPKSGIVQTAEGEIKLAEFLEEGQTLQDWLVGKSAARQRTMFKKIQKNFVADSLLANHDVAGLSFDNILIVKGKPWRIDNGGSLLFRAQGGAKQNFGAVVQELETLLDPKVNAQTARVFKGIGDEEIHAQIRAILGKRDKFLAAVPDDALRETLRQRLAYLEDRLPKTQPSGAASVRAKQRKPERGIATDTAERVEQSRVNGTTISGDREDIEDTNILVWAEQTPDGKDVTKVQFRMTEAGSRKVKAATVDPADVEDILGTARQASKVPNDPYWNPILNAIKTVNHHADDGAYNAQTLKALDDVEIKLKAFKGKGITDEDMITHYLDVIKDIKEAKDVGVPTPQLHEYVPKPKEIVDKPAVGNKVRRERMEFEIGEIKNARVRRVPRVNDVMDAEQYSVDFGDGVKSRFSLVSGTFDHEGLAAEGIVEIVVPGKPTTDALRTAMSKIKQLGIDPDPPSADFEELLYLHRTVYQNNDHNLKAYAKIWEDVDLSDAEKVKRIKKWAAKRYEVDFDELQKAGAYNPEGKVDTFGNGHRRWNRWDITQDHLEKEMSDYHLYHNLGGDIANVVDAMLQSGGEFTPTMERIRKGVDVVATGGWSSRADIRSGGANYSFTRIRQNKNVEVGLRFKIRNLMRQDSVSYSGDKFGNIGKFNQRKSKVLDYMKNAQHSTNETDLKHGISLLDELENIIVDSKEDKERVINVFRQNKSSTLSDGTKIEDIVMTRQEYGLAYKKKVPF